MSMMPVDGGGAPITTFEVPVVQTPPNILTGMSAEFQSVVLPLLYLEPQYRDFQGTAFCIGTLANGQMIFATAKHVLEPLLEGLTQHGYLLIPHLVQDVPGRFLARILSIDAISVATAHNDTALVRCDRRKANDVKLIDVLAMPLKFISAEVGSPTLALGYARHQITEELDFTRDFRASHGIVEALFHEGSDSFFGDFPSFQTNSVYDSGMSGGPVFDKDGACIGIVSRGANTLEGIEPWAYATPVACLGELGIDLESDDGSTNSRTFQQMVSGGIVVLKGEGGVTLTHDASGLRLQWLSNTTESSDMLKPEIDES